MQNEFINQQPKISDDSRGIINLDKYNSPITNACFNGAYFNRLDSFRNTESIETNDYDDNNRIEENDTRTTHDNDNINIYRYKFKEEFTNELYSFSKIHQYDHRKEFKEAWKTWTEENENLIASEITRLTNLGYDGDILDKMFKSSRYYFRKKSTEKKEPVKRRVYIGVQKELLEAIDEHILANKNSKPSDGFLEFCKSNMELLKEEISRLMKTGIVDKDAIQSKVKKTYKNRYFIMVCKDK